MTNPRCREISQCRSEHRSDSMSGGHGSVPSRKTTRRRRGNSSRGTAQDVEFDKCDGDSRKQRETDDKVKFQNVLASSSKKTKRQSRDKQPTTEPSGPQNDDASGDINYRAPESGFPTSHQQSQVLDQLLLAKTVEARQEEVAGTPRCEMDIIVYYGTSEVARYHVDNPFGCRLFYYPNLDKKLSVLNLLDPDGTEFHLAFGSRTRTQINLPTPDRDRDPDSVQLQLLEGFQRGLLLDFVSNDLFATRLCQCALYCSDSRFKTSEEGKLWTKERTKVFDYRQRFEPCFKRHCAGDAKCPSSELFLTFGRTWNADKDAAEESTVSVAIVHCLARSQIQAESHDILPSGMSMDIIDPDEGDKELEESLKGRGGGSRTGHQGSPTSSLSSSTD